MIEYILVLIVAVSIILGGIYQLNSAFKVWAENYFGNYLACLLETGELPSIGGNPGDSGLCNQLFKEFSLAEGRPRAPQPPVEVNAPRPSGGGGGSMRESSGGSVAGSGGGGFSGGSSFRGGSNSRSGSGRRSASRAGSSNTYTGSTDSADYGNNLGGRYRRQDTRTKDRLDRSFAFDDQAAKQNRRSISSDGRKARDDEAKKKERAALREAAAKRNQDAGPSSEFTIADFIRYLIIAAILIAMLFFLGGQALQIGKSME